MADYELSDEQLLAIQEDEDKKDRLTQAAVGFSAGAPAGMGQAAMKAADPGPVSDLAKAYHRSIKYIGTNPDKFAADAKLANDSGSPLKLIQSDENVRADAVRRSLYNKGRVPRYEQLNRIEKNNPATNRFLKRPGNIPMISDDPESLARGEDLITTAVNGYKSGDLQQRLGRLQFQNIINGDSESVNKEIDGIKSQLKEIGPEPEGLGGRMFYGAGQMLAQRRDQVARGAWYASAATLAAGITFGTMGLGAPVGGAMLAAGAGTGVLGGLAAMGPTQVAAGAAKAGFTAGASMEGLIQEAGLGYDELRDIRGENGEKLDPSVARAGGLIIGAVNAGIEFAQLDTWMKSIPGLKKIFTSEVAKKAAQIPLVQSYLRAAGKAGLAYLKTLGVESGQEVWQQTTNIAVRNAAKALSPGKFKYDKASDIFYELADTFGSSAIQFSIPMMVGPLMEGAQNIHRAAVTREYHISRAKGLSAIQQMMNNAAKDTPLAKRSPEKLGEFLSGVNDQLRNPFSSVFLPASAVQAYVDEKNMSAEQRSDLIEGLFGIKTDDFDASLSGGSDITIGSDKFALLNEQNEELGKRLFPELKAEADGIAIKDIDKAAETHKNTLRDEIRFTTAAAIGTQNAEDLAKMAENSGLDRVYVAPQAVQQLFQTATPEAKQQTLDAIGVSEADFDAALENNEDVEISTEKLLNGGVPTEVYKTLKDDLRAEPGAMTLRDAKNYEQTSAEQFGTEDTKAWRARAENTLSSIESAMKVKANMKAQLTLSGYADDVAENSAKVWAGHIMRSAQRIGVSPEEYAKIYANMKFVRGEKGEGLMQSVWHGSPQDFDSFSLEHIGEGEGAQAYGWGLYFAGSKEVSEWYRKKLASNEWTISINGKDVDLDALQQKILDMGKDNNISPEDFVTFALFNTVAGDSSISSTEQIINSTRKNLVDELANIGKEDVPIDEDTQRRVVNSSLQWLDKNVNNIIAKNIGNGQLYQVDIPDENGNYLLWDKPLSDQPESVKKFFEKYIPSREQFEELSDNLHKLINWKGSEAEKKVFSDKLDEQVHAVTGSWFSNYKDALAAVKDVRDMFYPEESGMGGKPASAGELYGLLSGRTGNFKTDKEESLAMRDGGIVGIKYLDGASRRAGEGSYNYVIFDDKAVTVLQKLYQSVRAIKDAVTIDTKKMGNFNTKFDYGSYSFDGLNNEQKAALAQKIASDAKLSSSEKIRLADAAINYYSEKIQGHPITNRYIGDVEFTGRGKNHFREKNSNYLKYYMIPFLPQLVETGIPMTNPENGTYDFGVKPYREDKESKKTKTVHPLTTTLVAFNYLQNTVDIDGNVYNIKIDIEKWSDGKKYYDITGLDKVEKDNKKDSSPIPTGLADNGTAYSAEQESFNNSPAPTGTSVTRVPGPTESGSAPVSTETAGNSALSPSDRNNNNVAQSDNSGNIKLTQVNAGQTRGSILLPKQFGGGVPIQVTITPNANASTAIHEMSHYFLWETAHLAELAPGDFELQNDLATIKNWLGWQDSQTEWTVEQQEKWARGFEAYMREGKAPSVELMGAFGRFRKWLCDIYKTMTELNVELTDDVRAVFGRMLATEEQTAEASSAYSMGGGEAEGGVVEQIVNAAANKQRASDAERSKAGILATILDEYESRMEEQKSAEYAEARKNVTDDVISMPVYRAMAAMENRPELKLSSDRLAEEYGNDVFTDLPKDIYAADGTATADEVAEQFGYESGDEMLKAIRTAPTIEQETAARLKALFGEDVPADERVGQMAEDDAYSKESVTPLMMEREGLTEAQGASNEEWDEILRQDEEAKAEADSPRSRPNVLRWIRDNGGLNYESVVGVFGKEQAQELLKKVGPGLFKKTGMGLDVAAESMTNEGALFGTNGVNADQDVFNILMGEDPPVSPLEVARREGFAEARKYARQQAEKRRAAARERQKTREERKKQAAALKEEKTKAVAEEKALNKELQTAAKEGINEARADAKAAEDERKAEERDAREAARQFAWESNQADLYEQRQDDKQHREALKQRAQMNGEAVLRAARDEVNRIKATQVDDRVKVYRAAEARARRECSAAMKDRDWERAMNAKDREILNHALAAEAKQAAKDLQNARVRIMEQQKRTPKNSGGITQEYINQIDLLFSRYSLKEESPRINAIPGLDSFCLSEERAGRPCPVAAWLRNGTAGKEWTSFSTGELRDFDDTLKWLIYSGREANRLSKEFATRNLGAVAENISGVILHNLVKLVANNNLKLAKNKDYDLSSRERITGRLAKLLSSLTKIEFITHILDAGERQGPVWDALFRPISEAEDSETLMSKKYSGEFEKLLNDTFDKKERRLMSKKKYYDMIGKNLSKEQVLAIALNMGNRTNRERILSGFGWNEQQLRYVVESTLSEKDWKFVQATWDLIDTLWPQVARLQRDIVGFLPERVEADMFFVRPKDWKVNKGYQMRGGYYPIAYNRESRQNRFIRIVSERQAMEDIFEGQWSYAMTKHGHTESRVKSTGFELRLDLGVVSEHINNVIHDLAYRKAIIDVNKILRYAYTDETGARHAPVEEAIIGSMGEEIYNQFQPWLQSIARDEVQPTNDFEHLFRWLRRRTQVVVLGLKVAVSLSQGLGWFPAAAEVGGYNLAKNILYFYRNPWSVQKKAQEVLAKSEAMRVRTDARDRDLRTLVHDLRREGKFNSIQETYFWFINLFDAGVVLPVWLTAYEKGMKTNGWDEKRAIAYADGVVRNTQDIGTPKDLSAVQRGTDSWKIFTMFYNAMNTQANMLIEQAWLARAGHTTKARMLGTMMYVVVLPAIAGALLSGQGPKPDDDGDDDENKLAKYFKWGAGEAAKYPFSFVPLLRDFANAAFGDYEFRGSAAFSPMSETAKAIRNVTKVAEDYEETDEIDWRKLSTSLLTASGYAFGLPAGQMKITLNALLDWLEGDKEVKPQDFFLYRKR